MQNNQPIPDWLFEHVQTARDLFGVGDVGWSIHVKMSDRPGGSASNDGWTHVNWKYLNADIEFSSTLEDGNAARVTATHEVGHIAMYEIDAVMNAILGQVDEDRREYLREEFIQAEERFLQRLARSFVYNWKQVEEDKDEQA